MKPPKKPYDYVKRGIDIVASGIGLVILSPVIGAVGLAVRAKLGSPVIFRQARPGRYGTIFTVYKFRSMHDTDESGQLQTDQQRLTPFGRALRASSLDELPSLYNVLKGEMSLVGPRPLLVEYLEKYSTEQSRRHDVRPGITGLAQINGRNDMTWEKKFTLDIEYVDKRSLDLDLRILLQTAISVLDRRGISKAGHATTDKFQGS